MPQDDLTELFYWVDEDDAVLGSVTRQEAHQNMEKRHRAVAILIINHEGEMLLQKRSQFKDTSPGLWQYAVGGHVTFGQSYEEAARREMVEEIGVSVPLVKKKKYFCTITNEFMTLFEGVLDDHAVSFDHNEVEKVAWVEMKKLADFVVREPFADWAKEGLEVGGYLKTE